MHTQNDLKMPTVTPHIEVSDLLYKAITFFLTLVVAKCFPQQPAKKVADRLPFLVLNPIPTKGCCWPQSLLGEKFVLFTKFLCYAPCYTNFSPSLPYESSDSPSPEACSKKCLIDVHHFYDGNLVFVMGTPSIRRKNGAHR
jgi:hypothetical protein